MVGVVKRFCIFEGGKKDKCNYLLRDLNYTIKVRLHRE